MTIPRLLGSRFRVLIDTNTASTSESASESVSESSIVSLAANKPAIKPVFYIPPDPSASRDSNETVLTMVLEQSRDIKIPTRARNRLSLVNEVVESGRLGSLGPAELRNERTNPLPPSAPPVAPRPGVIRNITVAEPPLPDPVPVSDDDFVFPSASDHDSDYIRAKYQDIEESWTGIPLDPSEKPRIIAIMASNIVDGFPKKNALFIKKFISDKGLPKSYKILRKKVFEESSFQELITIDNDRLPIPEEYKEVVDTLPYSNNQIMVYEDKTIENNNVYLYRVHLIWDNLTEEERRFRLSSSPIAGSLGDKVRELFGK